jgi:hypothetical protein
MVKAAKWDSWPPEDREALEFERIAEEARRTWSTSGPGCLVKVVPLYEVLTEARGFITQARYLVGKRPQQIETALGLRPLSFSQGCRVYRLVHLPRPGEYSYELTADLPGGEHFVFADYVEAQRRYEEDRSLRAIPVYPPGDSRIPQWKLREPVPVVHHAALAPLMVFPRPE